MDTLPDELGAALAQALTASRAAQQPQSWHFSVCGYCRADLEPRLGAWRCVDTLCAAFWVKQSIRPPQSSTQPSDLLG